MRAAAAQVRHRCRCPDGKEAVCGAEEAKVKDLSERGLLAANYILAADGTLVRRDPGSGWAHCAATRSSSVCDDLSFAFATQVQGTGAVKLLMEELGSAKAISTPYLPGAVKYQASSSEATTTSSQRKLMQA